MPSSKIHICNLALAMLGAAPIRSFDEDNKAARMCDTFFESTRDYMLSKFDWPFARAISKLQAIDTSAETLPPGYTAYGVPADCRTPRDILPLGSRQRWELIGNRIYTEVIGDVFLQYTSTKTDSFTFSDTFSNALALGIAVKMCPVITQDKKLTNALYGQFQSDLRDAWESDANIGSEYRDYDEDPDNDTFVNPGLDTKHPIDPRYLPDGDS